MFLGGIERDQWHVMGQLIKLYFRKCSVLWTTCGNHFFASNFLNKFVSINYCRMNGSFYIQPHYFSMCNKETQEFNKETNIIKEKEICEMLISVSNLAR